MIETQQTKEFYDFGEFRLDVPNRLLRRGDETVDLNLKEFEVLFFLVENAGRVVTKDNLLDAVWKDLFIEEGTLTQNISRLRKKLDAVNHTGGKIIETLPKRGYRFLPAVTAIETGNDLVIEEQTIQHFRIEETISIDEPGGFQGGGRDALLPRAPKRTRLPGLLKAVLGLLAFAIIGFAVYQIYLQRLAPKVIFASRLVPFSGLPGMEMMPSFSPDSKQIVFVWNGGNGENIGDEELFDVYVKIVGSGEPVRLTRSTTNVYFPVFSPDGKSIAFFRSSPDSSKIFLISALGGAERKICEVRSGATSFSFAPGGKTIATADRDIDTGENGIFLVDIETGVKTRLTHPPENFTDHTPRFSPDGKQIVFVRAGVREDQDLFIMPATDAAAVPRRMTFDRSGISGLGFLPDGASLIFASKRGGSSASNIWQIAVSGGEPIVIVTGGKNPINPAIAPDGKALVFVERQQDTNIWQLNSAPGIPPGGSSSFEKKLIASSRPDHSPQISPDGKKIVFVSDRAGISGLWISDLDGSNLLALGVEGGSPRFSPDSKFIAFGSLIDGKDTISIVSVDGGQPRQLVGDSADNMLPSWSADGHFIYFASNRTGNLQLWKIGSDGGGDSVRLTTQGAFESFAAPDGESIFYTKDRGIGGMWSVSPTGADEGPIRELAEAGFWRYWTVTSNGLYYLAYSPNPPYHLKYYDFALRQTKEIAVTDRPPILTYSGLSVSPDGKTILYAQRDQNASSIILADLGK